MGDIKTGMLVLDVTGKTKGPHFAVLYLGIFSPWATHQLLQGLREAKKGSRVHA
jgi:hypothetical protein